VGGWEKLKKTNAISPPSKQGGRARGEGEKLPERRCCHILEGKKTILSRKSRLGEKKGKEKGSIGREVSRSGKGPFTIDEKKKKKLP